MDYRKEKQKLQDSFHAEVRSYYEKAYSYNQIAKELNTTPQHIAYIVKNHIRGDK